MEHTLKSAIEYTDKGKAKEWMSKFLISTNNEHFAKKIQKGFFIGLVKLKLSDLVRCCGPEGNMKFHEDKSKFNKKNLEMAVEIKKGWDVPPLIIWFLDKKYSIADGCHRFEALKRCEYKEYWCFIWFKDKKDYEFYKGLE